MADVFISYPRARRSLARHLARILTSRGYTVWLDAELVAGRRFPNQLEAQVRAARAVVVLWCTRSVGSEWVIEEATLARDCGSYIPVTIEPVQPPFGLRLYHAIALDDWDGDPASPQLDVLVAAVAERVGRPAHNDDAVREQLRRTWLAGPRNEREIAPAVEADPDTRSGAPQWPSRTLPRGPVIVAALAVAAVALIALLFLSPGADPVSVGERAPSSARDREAPSPVPAPNPPASAAKALVPAPALEPPPPPARTSPAAPLPAGYGQHVTRSTAATFAIAIVPATGPCSQYAASAHTPSVADLLRAKGYVVARPDQAEITLGVLCTYDQVVAPGRLPFLRARIELRALWKRTGHAYAEISLSAEGELMRSAPDEPLNTDDKYAIAIGRALDGIAARLPSVAN